MKMFFRLLSFVALLTLSLPLAAENADMYGKWDKLPSGQLIVRANKFIFSKMLKADSALVCFSIVANRLEKSETMADRRLLCEAYMGLWTAYFFNYFDYKKSFDYLAKAKKAADGMPDMQTRVFFCYGNIYQTLATQWGDRGLAAKAVDNYVQAFWQGNKINSREIVNLAFSNLIPLMWQQGTFSKMKKMWPVYQKSMKSGKRVLEIESSDLLYKGYLAMYEGRNYDAVKAFKQQIVIQGEDPTVFRVKFNAYENLALAYSREGRYDKAISAVRVVEKWAKDNDMKDGKLEVYHLLQEYLSKSGDEKAADVYRRQYYMLKDSMQNYQRVMSVGELEFLGRIDAANRQVEAMRDRQRTSLIAFFVVVCFAVVITVSLVVVYRKNRALSQANRVLYKKNTDIQAAEDELRRLHKEQISTLMSEKAESTAVSRGVADNIKYKKSQLSETDKRQLMASINAVMDSSDEIFNTDFSVSRLAELVGSNYKYVSQVINEKTDGNFNSFLNDHRIREACRRIDSSDYDNYTIEALSNSVGFKSRTSFFTSFKHFTGLTPSEYIRLAKEKKK